MEDEAASGDQSGEVGEPGDLRLDHPQARVAGHRAKVVQAARGQVVDDHHRRSVREQPLRQMRADEPGAAGDEDWFVHPLSM